MTANNGQQNSGQLEGVIYRYINETEGEEKGWSYVGSTKKERQRIYSWNNHGNKSYGGKKINEARSKYGPENFTREVLEKVHAKTESELDAKLEERETYYIKKFNSVLHGYNTSTGGTGNKGVNFDKEWRRKIGEKSKGRKKTLTAEEINRLLSFRKIKIEVTDEDGNVTIFDSLTQAATELSVSISTIHAWAHNKPGQKNDKGQSFKIAS